MATNKGANKNKVLAKLVTDEKGSCGFCQRDVNDEVLLGKLYVIGDIKCHYFCVLLSCCLVQKGRDEDGLFGFLYQDIKNEIERSKKHKCSYCSRDGATLGCCISQCRKQFHLPCGRERNAVSLFFGSYKSYCQKHSPKQKIPENIMAKAKIRMQEERRRLKLNKDGNGQIAKLDSHKDDTNIDAESVCVICYETVQGYPTLQTFWPPCCARDAWFHRSCVQRMALTAGMHYLKCPLCNDKENFYEAVINQGYYVPDRDAAWELEQNAFSEIYERQIRCDVEDCKCPMGRNHDSETGIWDIKLCLLCGSSGGHAHCLPDGRYVCRACAPAAPTDLDQLADSIDAVVLAEQRAQTANARRRPIMPSRMSLRRTKQRIAYDAASASTSRASVTEFKNDNKETTNLNTSTSRQELNLRTPKRREMEDAARILSPSKIDVFSPTKMVDTLFEKINKIGGNSAMEYTYDEVRERFRKPKPLSAKRKIVDNILDTILNGKREKIKSKETIKEWFSPKKVVDVNGHDEKPQGNLPSVLKLQFPYKSPKKILKRLLESEKMDFKNANYYSNANTNINDEIIFNDNDVNDKANIINDENNIVTNNHLHDKNTNLDVTDFIIIDKHENELPNNTVNIVNGNLDVENDILHNIDHTTVIGSNENTVNNIDHGSTNDHLNGNIEIISNGNTVDISHGNVENYLGNTGGIDNENVNDMNDDSSNSTFQLAPEFIADSNDSFIYDTPKLKTVEIQQNSIEISENNEIINVNVLKMSENTTNCDYDLNISPLKNKSFKFNPKNEILHKNNIDIDVESFKNHYLNEVGFKCRFKHRHIEEQSVSKLRTAIDFAVDAVNKIKLDDFSTKSLKSDERVVGKDIGENIVQIYTEDKNDFAKNNNLFVKSDDFVGEKDELKVSRKRKLTIIEDEVSKDKKFAKKRISVLNDSMEVRDTEENIVSEIIKKNKVSKDKKSKKSKVNSKKRNSNKNDFKSETKDMKLKGNIIDKRNKIKKKSNKQDKYTLKYKNNERDDLKLSLNNKKKKLTRVSIKDKGIKVKIQWKKEKLKLKIKGSKGKSKKESRRGKNESTKAKKDSSKVKKDSIDVKNESSNDKKESPSLKQYVLNYSDATSKDVLEKPNFDVTPLPKRKYVKQEKTVDNLKQTSIQSFFIVFPKKEES